MKFKTLFLLFNLILLVSFAFIFLMPLPVLGWEYAVSFWGQNWYIGLAFVVILAALDLYFVRNWKLFSMLEREDWAGLRKLLETELERRGVLSLSKTRILVNACLIGQSVSRISELRARYLAKTVRFLPRIALSLGLPLVLEGKSDEVEAFFGPLADEKQAGADLPWIRWCLAFSRLLKQDVEKARPLLISGLSAKQPVLRLLSLYLLDNLKTDPEVRSLIDQHKPGLAALTAKEWTILIDGLKEKVILILFMEKLIGDARQWLAQGGTA